jgi:hypothetical protein
MKKKFYLKERHNPQFNAPYCIKLGELTPADAQKAQKSIYGYNVILSYETENEYNIAIASFKKEGYSVHD